MSSILSSKVTVYFETQFWVGVFERIEDGNIETCKIVFGPEPKSCEIYEFISKNYNNLRFSRPISIDTKAEKKINPKRLQREIRRATQEQGISTKAQQAIKIEHESRKVERKKLSKEKIELKKKIDFEKKQQKKKQKKKGH